MKQRGSPAKVAAFLKHLATLKQLDTAAYLDEVNKKKVRKSNPKPKVQQCLSRRAKKRIHKLEKQNTRLRCDYKRLRVDNKKLRADNTDLRAAVFSITTCHPHTCFLIHTLLSVQVERLQTENDSLKETIKELHSGHHDIRLQGQSQTDMETVMHVWSKQPQQLDEQLQENDKSGTLKAFWQEQLKRTSSTNKREQWNPVVLRFMLHLWESMGEKNFRLLGDEKV